MNYISNNFEFNSARYISDKINSYWEDKKLKHNNIKFLDDLDSIFHRGKNYYGRKLKNNKLPYYSTDVLIEMGHAAMCNDFKSFWFRQKGTHFRL
jgi:hypothetical protein